MLFSAHGRHRLYPFLLGEEMLAEGGCNYWNTSNLTKRTSLVAVISSISQYFDRKPALAQKLTTIWNSEAGFQNDVVVISCKKKLFGETFLHSKRNYQSGKLTKKNCSELTWWYEWDFDIQPIIGDVFNATVMLDMNIIMKKLPNTWYS